MFIMAPPSPISKMSMLRVAPLSKPDTARPASSCGTVRQWPSTYDPFPQDRGVTRSGHASNTNITDICLFQD